MKNIKIVNLVIMMGVTICFLIGGIGGTSAEAVLLAGEGDLGLPSLGGPEVLYRKVSSRDQNFIFAKKLFDRGFGDLASFYAQKIYDDLKDQILKAEKGFHGNDLKEKRVDIAPAGETDSTLTDQRAEQERVNEDLLRIAALLLRIKMEKWFSVGLPERKETDREIGEIRSFVESENRFLLAARSDFLKTFSSEQRTAAVLSNSASQTDPHFSMKDLWARSPFLNYLDTIADWANKEGIILYCERKETEAFAVWKSFLTNLEKFQQIPELPELVRGAFLYYRVLTLLNAAVYSPEEIRVKLLQGILDNVPFPKQSEGGYTDLLKYQLVKNLRLLKKYEEAATYRDQLLSPGIGSFMELLMTSEKIRALSDSGRDQESVKLATQSLTKIKENGVMSQWTNGSSDPLFRRSLEELLAAQLESFLKEGEKKRTEISKGHQEEITELTDLLNKSGSFRRLLISGLLVERGGSHELEKLGKEAWTAGQFEKAIGYYDRASDQAFSAGRKSDAFRLIVTAASILDEDFRRTMKGKKLLDDDSAALQKKVMARFLDSAFRYSSEGAAEDLADYGLRLAENLYENNRLSAEELIQILNRREKAFANSTKGTEYQFRRELLYLVKNKNEKNEAFLSPENAREFLSLLSRIRAEKLDLPLLNGREVQFYEAEAFYKAGHDQEALNRFGALLRDHPGQIEYQERIALILSRQNDPKVLEKALVFWNEVVKNSEAGSPAWLRAKKNIISIYEKTERKEQANKMRQMLHLTYPAFE